MPRRKVKSEPTHFERMVGLCIQSGHETAALVVKGRSTIVCFECDTHQKYNDALGRTPERMASRHFTDN